MSREAFIEHYETHHRKIGEKYLSGFAVKYQRRYLQSAGFRGHEALLPPFDVLMEIWYPDQDTLDAALAVLSTDEAQAEIMADEERHRAYMYLHMVPWRRHLLLLRDDMRVQLLSSRDASSTLTSG